MSRSGYSDDGDFDQWGLIRYRGAVTSAFKGRRGQTFLKEMLAALDALPEPKLIAHELETSEGAVCALGAVSKARGLDVKNIDPEDTATVANVFGVAEAFAREIVFMNDDDWGFQVETPERRFERMRKWIEGEIRETKAEASGVSDDR